MNGVRRRAREMALQLLFQTEFLSAPLDQLQASEMSKWFIDHFEIPADVAEYGAELFNGIAGRLKEIDAIIQSHSSHWKTSRMGLVDLSVMRVAVFEMKLATPPIPPSVSINEAVELAKQFGSTESGAFVNGVLDHVARSLT
ncbi:MAG: transcription antitermination factor NusB [Bdellovibrionota bacterium]